MNAQDLYDLDKTIYEKIQADRKKKEAETKAFFDGMEEGAEMMRKAVQEDIAILCSGLPAFETGKMIFDTL